MLQLKKFPDIPVSTREEARESRPHPEDPRFHLLAREEGSFPCVVGKEFPRSRRISRGGALHRKGERNSTVVPPFPESPRCISPFQGNLFSLQCLNIQAEDRLTTRCLVGQPCGKASWESLVGKPRGKDTDPLIHGKGSVTLLLQLGRKAHVHAPTRDEDFLPWGDSRNPPISMSALEWNPPVPAPTLHKVLGPSIDGRGLPRGPMQLAWGLAFPEATRAGPRGPRRKSRAPAATRENPGGSPFQAR